MKRAIFFGAFICFLISTLNAQDDIDLSGIVKNQADFPVFGLEVSLKAEGCKDTTDSAGHFKIYESTGIISNAQKRLPAPKFRGTHFIIPVIAGNQRVSVEVFNLKGSKISTISKVLPAGEHSIPLFNNRNGRISSSVLIAVVKRGSDMSRFRIIKTGMNGYMVRGFAGGASDYSQTLAKASNPLPALDSLTFIRRLVVEGQQEEFVEFTFPVEKWVDSFKVTLDLIPYEAIEWGKTQEGRSNETLGQELGKPGSGIYPYEFDTYYNGAWCSEFHCYIMRIGGCPLGDDGGTSTNPNWMLWDHNQLEDWYDDPQNDNADYVEEDEIDPLNYVPNPGDFIHVTGHTTTVRYIDDNDDCYCLGGNEGDKVVLNNRGNYKNLSGFLGYGRRSGVVEDSYESVSK